MIARQGGSGFRLVVLLAGVFATPGPAAEAAMIEVDTAVDETTTNGRCSLREAIANADTDSAGTGDCATGSDFDEITFSGLDGATITLAGTQLTVATALSISGPPGGITIDGGGQSRVFVFEATSLDSILQDLTITGGAESTGGGGGNGIGILNNGDLSLNRVTIAGNTASNGALWNGGMSLEVINSTISGNTILSGPGGAVFNNGANLVIRSSTITDNDASVSGNGGIRSNAGTVSLTGTIVANQAAGADCSTNDSTIVDDGFNLDSDDSCGFALTADPILGPLTDNGGSTDTHALLEDSPAIDAIPDGSCTVSIDQRNVVRPQTLVAANCDIGAVEALDANMDGVPDEDNCPGSDDRATVAVNGTDTDPVVANRLIATPVPFLADSGGGCTLQDLVNQAVDAAGDPGALIENVLELGVFLDQEDEISPSENFSLRIASARAPAP